MSVVSIEPNDLHPDVTDLQAVDEVLRGNREMFEVLVRRYNRRLFRVGFSYLRHREQTEDAMQNAYLKAYTHLHTYERTASFATWLTRILINECLMALRRHRRAAEEALFEEDDAPAADEGGIARLNRHEMKALLEIAIASLPQSLRTVYMLREVQQLSTEETAACLGVTQNNVKVTLHRARERLKTALLESAAGIELFSYRAERCDPFTARVMRTILRAH